MALCLSMTTRIEAKISFLPKFLNCVEALTREWNRTPDYTRLRPFPKCRNLAIFVQTTFDRSHFQNLSGPETAFSRRKQSISQAAKSFYKTIRLSYKTKLEILSSKCTNDFVKFLVDCLRHFFVSFQTSSWLPGSY
jgi:hypothetical protein